MGEDWSDIETEVTVADYFDMLSDEISGISYNKAEHRRKILPLLNNRAESSVEFKHQNISAILSKFGVPWIAGYKPRWNYQKLLEEKVLGYLTRNPQLESLFESFSTASVTVVDAMIGFSNMCEAPPEFNASSIINEPEVSYLKTPLKVNYLEIEQANRKLGLSGEEVIFAYERWRLIDAGKDSLSDKIEWVAQTKGDGLGFDILSKNTNGTDRYIEVKTTKLSKDAPIFFSQNEYNFSIKNSLNYFLYRVFNFAKAPKFFIVNGRFDDFCNYQPVKYKGQF
ncbi:MAG TPA: DUF3883 domain-containing protein [Cyclobacteriaceae bacterium]|jgi:hypothetical protein|nr:DUF3883 domain-containing protein [Cyclobacteriaceae bacterium]